ncbi:hypothetical protein EVJ58_g4266 [Rhodofomes roseus]|uniref:Uncharacterized protein n=1 Tax=Rhodofomes roseus TaxID=34475 RepID=A0A4Y9YJN1_9APHY|nr:hypothetical protein EVJ58_g4266 [Rhodofomes roseus]
MLWRSLVLLLATISIGASQVPFTPVVNVAAQSWLSRPWNERPSEDATGNLIFQSLSSLLQMMPNSKHPIGHSITRVTIPQGTVLYHGRFVGGCPSMDWIAFDPEHAMMFAFGRNGTLLTYTATRDLQLVYFDGCSGNKLGGVIDTQDILIWGAPRAEGNTEIMYCNFTQGLELVSAMSTVNPIVDWEPPMPFPTSHQTRSKDDPPPPPQGPNLPGGHCTPEATFHGLTKDRIDEHDGFRTQEPDIPFSYPKGWKGALPNLDIEAFHAGTWHNQFPGEVRVHVDPSSMISLYDPALTSLVEARRSMTRDEYRPANISEVDIARVRSDIAEVMTRDPAVKTRVDWEGLARVVQDRFGDRLPFMRHLLHEPVTNATAQIMKVRKQLVASLIPYMPRTSIGKPEWFATIARNCAVRFTDHLPQTGFTKQEQILLHAVEEVLHEICRVYTEAWVDAFDAEGKPASVIREWLVKWRDDFDSLVEWLDWPVWIKCDPACGVDANRTVRKAAGCPKASHGLRMAGTNHAAFRLTLKGFHRQRQTCGSSI